MTNINSFSPLRKKGWALDLNAGGGNVGVAVVQLAVIGAAGGPRVFVAMAAATGVMVLASVTAPLALFTTAFLALFVLSGLGNGSTYKMICGIFQAKSSARALIGAVGALGGLGINLTFRQSFQTGGTAPPRSSASPATTPSATPPPGPSVCAGRKDPQLDYAEV